MIFPFMSYYVKKLNSQMGHEVDFRGLGLKISSYMMGLATGVCS